MTKKILEFFGKIIGMSIFLWIIYIVLCIGNNFKPTTKPTTTLFWIFFAVFLSNMILLAKKYKNVKDKN